MKNIIKAVLAIMISGILFSGCSDDGYSVDNFTGRYGTVLTKGGFVGKTNDYNILLDDGSLFYAMHNLEKGVLYEDGDRIYAIISIWDDRKNEIGGKDYYGRINETQKILSKPPVKQSQIDEDPELDKELGDDQVVVTRARFSGKYLNVSFKFAGSYYPPKPHFINVVENDIEVEEGKAVITMRHNGFGDVPTDEDPEGYYLHPGFISFDISSLMPEGAEEIEVVLKWYEYGDGDDWWNERVENTKTGTFKYKPRDLSGGGSGTGGINSKDEERPDPLVNKAMLY